MKKLMIAAAVAACATVGLAEGEITSKNIVGYNQKATGETMYPIFGACFTPVDGSSTYKLGAITVEGIDPEDAIQVINGNDLTDVLGMYGYIGSAYTTDPSQVGWYDVLNGTLGDPDSKCDDTEIKIGQAFMGFILSGATPTFKFNGEAPTVTTSVSSEGAMYPFFACYIPREIPLNWMVPEGIDPEDAIQVINGNDLTDVLGMYGYISADYTADPSQIGWYDVLNGTLGDPDSKIDDSVTIKPGDGFEGFVMSGNTVNFQFPSSTKNVTE